MGSLKLTSFFTVTENLTGRVSGICGSYLYMAPEVLLGKEYNHTADVWSVGVILYMLVTRRHPLYHVSASTPRFKVKEFLLEKYRFTEEDDLIDFSLPECSEFGEVGIIMHKLLEIEPSKRISLERISDNPIFKQAYKSHREKVSRVGEKDLG